jgi:hypothetical protein
MPELVTLEVSPGRSTPECACERVSIHAPMYHVCMSGMHDCERNKKRVCTRTRVLVLMYINLDHLCTCVHAHVYVYDCAHGRQRSEGVVRECVICVHSGLHSSLCSN